MKKEEEQEEEEDDVRCQRMTEHHVSLLLRR